MRLLLFLLLAFSVPAVANDSTKLYDPKANAARDIGALLLKAKKEKKYILLQVGGNWCVGCYRLNAFIQTDSSLKKLVDNNFIIYHLNYSAENRNPDYLRQMGFPQRFGFPVLVVVDENGNRLHTQDAVLLQKGNGYDHRKVKDFLRNWSPPALDANFYKE